MESFKHSCPFCGQHIEYTVGYCGKQIQCPMCGQTVTFPAIPPTGTGPTLRVKSSQSKPLQNWSKKLPSVFSFLGDFQHWNVVAQCAVPFLILAVLVAGAIVVKNKYGESDSGGATPLVQAEPEAWQKVADLNKADQAVKASMKVLATAHANADMAETRLREVKNMEAWQRKSAEDQVLLTQRQITAARQQFDKAENLYHQLGGTINYRSLCPRY